MESLDELLKSLDTTESESNEEGVPIIPGEAEMIGSDKQESSQDGSEGKEVDETTVPVEPEEDMLDEPEDD